MVGVLAHADVGDGDEIRNLLLQRLHSLLHGAVLVPRRRTNRILRVGNAEQNNSTDFRFRRCFRIAKHLVD